jgi:uncharacterized membrane protein YjgN (DUF898 family)
LFFYLFAQFAVYRARRYRLSRTIWRGVRFSMTGSGWDYAWRAGLWMLLVIVTFGVALPWYLTALERFKMRHTSFGSLAGRFEGTGWDFFKRAWWLWLVGWLWLGHAVIILTASGHASSLLVIIPLLVLFATIGSPFLYTAYKAAEWRWWVAGVRFGDVRFECRLTMRALVGLYWKVIGWSMLLLFGLSSWVGGLLGAVLAGKDMAADETMTVLQRPSVLIAMAAGYVIAALAFGAVMRIYLRRDVWARVASSLTVHNIAAADNVAARGDLVDAIGEGLADSLDIGGL